MKNSLNDTSEGVEIALRSFTTETRRHGVLALGGGQLQNAKASRHQEIQGLTFTFAALRLGVLAWNSPLFSVLPCLRDKHLTLAVSPHLVPDKRGGQP